MKRLTSFAFHHRAPIIAVFLALTAFFAFWIKDLRVNSDVVSYLPREDPAVQLFDHLGDKFRQNDIVLVAVETDNVFSASSLRDIDLLTQAFQGVQGISSVLSLADMMDIRKASDGGIEIGRLFDRAALQQRPSSARPCGPGSWATRDIGEASFPRMRAPPWWSARSGQAPSPVRSCSAWKTPRRHRG